MPFLLLRHCNMCNSISEPMTGSAPVIRTHSLAPRVEEVGVMMLNIVCLLCSLLLLRLFLALDLFVLVQCSWYVRARAS